MRVGVVGSGPAGVAAATALLEGGHTVEMLDVGHLPEPAAEHLTAEIRARIDAGLPPTGRQRARLRRGFAHAGRSGLRAGLRSLLRPGIDPARGLKPNAGSDWVFDQVDKGIPLEGALVPRSLSQGGLSNVWGAACYPLRDDELDRWPLTADDLAPHYARAVELLGVEQVRDGLESAYPLHGRVAASATRDPESPLEGMLERWAAHRDTLTRAGLSAGRSRLAVRQRGHSGDGCRSCGLCFYGCPYHAIYTGRRTVTALLDNPAFSYLPDHFVHRFEEHADGVRVVTRRSPTGSARPVRSYDALYLGAGVLGSLRIAADSLPADEPARVLDNSTFILPMVGTTGAASPPGFRASFTLSEAVLHVAPGAVDSHGVHIQLYAFHDYFLQELGGVLGRLPRPLANLPHAALNQLCVAFVCLASPSSHHATATVRPSTDGAGPDGVGRVRLEVTPNPASDATIARLLTLLRSVAPELGLRPLSALMKQAPLGFGGHLAGTLPMRADPGALECSADGRLVGTERVYVADAAALPALPAQNLTMTIVANALRVASGPQ